LYRWFSIQLGVHHLYQERITLTFHPDRKRLVVLQASRGLSTRNSVPVSIAMLALLLFVVAALLAARSTAQSTPMIQAQAPRPSGQNQNGIHVYIWAGLKSHLAGQHDYPQFLADWSKILTDHGAVVDGALHGPSPRDLEHSDVVVIYKGDAGYLGDEEKLALESFVKRGGGLVSLHDSLCGPDPKHLANLLGGAKKHGEINYTLGAPIAYSVKDTDDPIMKGMSNFTIFDEAFFNMTWALDPRIHVLATTVIPGTPSAGAHKDEVVPQIWTYEHTLAGGQPARAFVWMQGHEYANFANYQIRQMLLRGIAWAAHKPVDSLVDYVPPTSTGTSSPGDRR
jgi:type 1 glutamine amidotransferase